jgi:hypothetical protein
MSKKSSTFAVAKGCGIYPITVSGQNVTAQNGSLPYGIYVVHTPRGAKKVWVY